MNGRYESKIQQLVNHYPQLQNKPWFRRIIQNRILIGDTNNNIVRLHIAHVKRILGHY